MNEYQIQRKLLSFEEELDRAKAELNSYMSLISQQQQAIRAHGFDIDRNTRALDNTHGGKGITVFHGPAGELEIIGADISYPQPFDITGIAAASFKIENNLGKTLGMWLGGTAKTVTDGTGAVWNAGEDLWDFASITTEGYAYLLLERDTATVTINFTQTLPTGTITLDTDEIFPLWYLPWNTAGSGSIDSAGVIDLRGVIHVTTFS